VTAPAGLAVERTRLAWRRTALGGTAVALLAARLAITTAGGATTVALLGVALAGWLGVLLATFRRLRGMRPGRPPSGRVVGLAALAVGFAGLGVAQVLLGGPG
jgi:hypothetical protein